MSEKKIMHILPSDYVHPYPSRMTKAELDAHWREREFERATYRTTKEWAKIIEGWEKEYSKDSVIYTECGGREEALTISTLEGDLWAVNQWGRR